MCYDRDYAHIHTFTNNEKKKAQHRLQTIFTQSDGLKCRCNRVSAQSLHWREPCGHHLAIHNNYIFFLIRCEGSIKSDLSFNALTDLFVLFFTYSLLFVLVYAPRTSRKLVVILIITLPLIHYWCKKVFCFK